MNAASQKSDFKPFWGLNEKYSIKKRIIVDLKLICIYVCINISNVLRREYRGNPQISELSPDFGGGRAELYI